MRSWGHASITTTLDLYGHTCTPTKWTTTWTTARSAFRWRSTWRAAEGESGSYDVSEAAVGMVNAARMPFAEQHPEALLSKTAGRSLHLVVHVGTCHATNSFKAYPREFIQQAGIGSRDGFEIGLELTAKAKRMQLPVAEIPTSWLDLQTGVSHVRVVQWMPKYFRWHQFAFGPYLSAEQLHARASRHPSSAASPGEARER